MAVGVVDIAYGFTSMVDAVDKPLHFSTAVAAGGFTADAHWVERFFLFEVMFH